MSDLYEKQVEWKRNQATRARTSSGKDDEDITFQPVFFTSKDTSRKFRVTEKVETLSAVAGNQHVDRFKKAAQLREEAHKKLYGGPTASAAAAAAAAASVTVGSGSSASVKKGAKLGSAGAGAGIGMQSTGGYASIGLRTGTASSGGTAAYYSGAGAGVGGAGDDALPLPIPPPTGEESRSSSSSSSSSSGSTAEGGSAAPANTNAWGSGTGSSHRTTSNDAAAAGAAASSAFASSPDEYAVVELLERERREWHLERTKLVQCIHLQQLELAARASAAQETAGAIAKEFAASIEEYEARLVLVESSVQRELEEVKDMLRRALSLQGQGQGQGEGELKAKGEAKVKGEAKAALGA